MQNLDNLPPEIQLEYRLKGLTCIVYWFCGIVLALLIVGAILLPH
jgi:hypothetical protein